ncbi:MAG: aldehyde dehydrogenase family protein [Roseinatronobacter sp.]
MIDKRQFYIGGQWVDPLGPADHPVINPATEAPIARISLGTAGDIDRAVTAAQAAFAGWSRTPPAERRALVVRLLQIYRARYDEMVSLLVQELGAPRSMCHAQQADVGIGHVEGFLAAFDRIAWREEIGNGDILTREPIGVCGLITPWNWPINQIVLKVIPALLTGCTAVLKPSELTPLSAMLYAEMIHDAGVPPGVFNLVNGTGETGAALSCHRDVAMMSFTGSTRAGIAVSRDAAPTIKRVTLELGGKSPNLIFADCDLAQRLPESLGLLFNNSGQSCDAPTRLLVERSIYDQVVRMARDLAQAQLVGDPAQPGAHIGPLVSQTQFDRVQALIHTGLEDGARLIAGGPGRPEGITRGYFVRPTVFADVTNQMTVARTEIFGPVAVLIPFEDEDEAIALANDTDYGLAAYIQTGDPARARRVAARLRAGMIFINGAAQNYGSPFGGFRQSGNGREGGLPGLEEFLELKTLHMPEGFDV